MARSVEDANSRNLRTNGGESRGIFTTNWERIGSGEREHMKAKGRVDSEALAGGLQR
jgi:hypothetical protein